MDDQQLIVALGGSTRVAAGLHAAVSTVDSWKRKSRIPRWWRPQVMQLAERQGVAVPASWRSGQPQAAE